MIQNLWQEKLKLNYNQDIFDIIQFGSSVIENNKPNDIDIAIIFKSISLKEQLDQAQLIKMQLQKISNLPIHIKSFDIYSFFDESNFTKENILFYGKSLISKDYFSKKLGLNPKIQIYYSLKNMKKKEKIKFNYMLNGKNGKYGLLKKYGGNLLSPGLIEIFPQYENIFIESIKKLTNNFKIKKVLY
ncbi:MAG: hypothetical protein PHF86_10520 [Candidatus Nanoarchaeia archaeon]|nr:hypothetical protein [Candidatus Nanoarchaeia archaeon]